jgi:nucleotide-binding universal stress UspA family protein
MLPIRVILHPTDFSVASEHARQMAYELARDYGARLLFLHSVEPPVYYGELGVNYTASDGFRELARERVDELVEPGSQVQVETIVADGEPGEEILRVAKERQADLLVIGSHGRTGLGRVLMGSVAEEVARKSPCPVLIVRAPHEIAHTVATAPQVATS